MNICFIFALVVVDSVANVSAKAKASRMGDLGRGDWEAATVDDFETEVRQHQMGGEEHECL